MLRFFRKMRNALVPESRFGRYFFYALGEIVLVVIGILIALQVNNWNENRKIHKQEINYIISLKEELQQDSTKLESLLKLEQNSLDSCNTLLGIIRTKKAISFNTFFSIVYYAMNNTKFIPNQNTFNEMVSSGTLGVIKNDSIKSLLIKLDRYYDILDFTNQFIDKSFSKYIFDKYILFINHMDFADLNYFETMDDVRIDSVLVENNSEKLKKAVNSLLKDNVFDNGLFILSEGKRNLIQQYKDTLKIIQNLIHLIDNELKR